jgi:hypothetical protein
VLRGKIAAEWSKMNNVNITPDMIICTDCTGSGVKGGYCSQCEIRKCASGKGIVNCGACTEFKICKIINDFIAKNPFVSDILIQK